MATTPNGYEGIKTGSMEYIKQHLVYDGSNRLVTVYEARANAANADYCLVTTYSFDGISLRVVGMKEAAGTWNSSWDI